MVIRTFILGLLFFSGVSTTFAQKAAPTVKYSVPDISGRAIDLVKPAFPETAVVVDGDGSTLVLKVVVDEGGNAISAQCSLNCHWMLKDAAELAAMTTKFRPLIVDGRAVKYEGSLMYHFVVERVNWFGFGTALESTRQFDNISFGPVAQILSAQYSDERSRLTALDADGGANYDERQKGIAELENTLRPKLRGLDLWQFELGMAMRRATFWLNAGKIDRVEMQKALTDMETVIASAPEGVSKQVIDDLRAMSRFRIPKEASDRELAKMVYALARRIPLDPK
jgi:hypothetical protein